MRFEPEHYDEITRKVCGDGPNMLVPYFLMASFAYYELDNPFLTDACYDWLCGELDRQWDRVEHFHKHVVERDSLRAGTGFNLSGKYPLRVQFAAAQLMGVAPPGVKTAAPIGIDDLLGPAVAVDDLL